MAAGGLELVDANKTPSSGGFCCCCCCFVLPCPDDDDDEDAPLVITPSPNFGAVDDCADVGGKHGGGGSSLHLSKTSLALWTSN